MATLILVSILALGFDRTGLHGKIFFVEIEIPQNTLGLFSHGKNIEIQNLISNTMWHAILYHNRIGISRIKKPKCLHYFFM